MRNPSVASEGSTCSADDAPRPPASLKSNKTEEDDDDDTDL